MRLLLLLFTAHVAAADPGPPGPESAPQAVPARPLDTPERQLQEAKRRYFSGDSPGALDLLVDLQVRWLQDTSSLPPQIADEALIYLGEVYLMSGDVRRCRDAWRPLLEADPDRPILSPFTHPPEVGREFELLRARVRNEIPAPLPVPAWDRSSLGAAAVH